MAKEELIKPKSPMLVGSDDAEFEEYEEESEDDDEDEEEESNEIVVSLACEDCDYRWEILVDENEEDTIDFESSMYCPMCGSSNVTQI